MASDKAAATADGGVSLVQKMASATTGSILTSLLSECPVLPSRHRDAG